MTKKKWKVLHKRMGCLECYQRTSRRGGDGVSSWDGKAYNENGEPLMTGTQYRDECAADAQSQIDAMEYEMYDSPEAQFEPEMGPWSYVYEAFYDAGVENDYLLDQMVAQFKSMHSQIVALKKGVEYEPAYRALQEQYDYLQIQHDNISFQLDELRRSTA